MAEKAAGRDEDDEDADADGDEKPARRFDLKTVGLFIVLPLVLLLLAIGGALYFTGFFAAAPPPEEAAATAEQEAAPDAHGPPAHSVFLPMPPMNVNLQTESGQARYLRISVQLELGSEGDKAAVEKVMPRVVDAFQTYLRELRVEDLRGSAGLYRLQVELLWRVNQAAHPVRVHDVLFQEILIN
jgi:flagellar protein FliL